MKITFLGTNGWFDTPTGNTTCTFVETENEYIILDAGGGFYKALSLVITQKPVYLFLSHLHMDHFYGLQTLPLFKWKQGLRIITPDNMAKELLSVMRPPFLPAPASLNMKIEIEEISSAKLHFSVKHLPLEHIVTTIGYRFEIDGKILTYALDSGYTENLITLAKDADMLITECSYLPGESPNNNHLNPQQAAQAAQEAGVKALAIIHFLANIYTTFEQRDEAMAAAGMIFGHTYAPYDGDSIVI